MDSLRFYCLLTLAVLFHNVTADVCVHNKCLDTSGKHFIVTLPSVANHFDGDCQIHIASMQNGFAKMTRYTATNSEEIGNFTLRQGVTAYVFRGKSISQEQQGIQTRAIEVVSTVDVRVYVNCEVPAVAAAFVVLPTTFYGRKYVWSSYKSFISSMDNILIITSIYNDTRVEIKNIPQSSDRNETLNQYDSLAITTTSDPNVTVISSDKPVNVVSGCMCASVPINAGNCDTMYDSPLPVEYWGNEFIVPPMVSKSGYVVRIYTNSSNTTIRLQYNNGFENKNMSFSSMMELILNNRTTAIVTDHPVAVVQYGFPGGYDNTIGDSFMASVPAVKHFSKDYVFPTVFAGKGYTHRIAVTIATSEVNGLVLNGRSLSAVASFALWSVPHPLSDYSVVTVDLPEDNYILVHRSSDVRFSVLYYGLKEYFGLGYYLGFSFPLTETEQCASNPCMNGGTCVDNKTQISCICPVAVTGPSCEYGQVRNVTLTASVGGLLKLQCGSGSAVSSTSFTWTKQNSCNESLSNFTGDTYTISDVAFGDAGLYICRAKNGNSMQTAQFSVQIQGGHNADLCTFDDQTLCGWSQEQADDFDWTLQSGPTQSEETGPDNDHTLRNEKGSYLYIESSAPRNAGDRATIESHNMPGGEDACLSFWYYLYGDGIGTLTVLTQDSCTKKTTHLFRVSGDKGEQWIQAKVDVSKANVTNDYTFLIEATVGPTYHGDIAIDDVQLYTHKCSGDNPQIIEMDQCASNPSINGGTCVDNKTQFWCICQVAFTGPSYEHALPTMSLPLGNLMCFRCEDTSSLAFCDTIESCKSNEVCFLERFTTPEGHVRFRSGCKDKQTCSLHNQTDAVQQDTCLDCCDVSFCNSQGCGDAGFPPPASRGPICLDCAHVKHPTQCDQVTLCSSNELCYAEEVKWGAESLFHLGCKSNHQCAFESRSAVTRAVPVCRSCCHGDFCNQNCTEPDNYQSPVIVG